MGRPLYLFHSFQYTSSRVISYFIYIYIYICHRCIVSIVQLSEVPVVCTVVTHDTVVLCAVNNVSDCNIIIIEVDGHVCSPVCYDLFRKYSEFSLILHHFIIRMWDMSRICYDSASQFA